MGATKNQRQYGKQGEGDCYMKWLAKVNKRKYSCTTHSVVLQRK